MDTCLKCGMRNDDWFLCRKDDCAAKATATLEAENDRLRARGAVLEKALEDLVHLNDTYAPFGGELYQDRIDRTWNQARAALTPTTENTDAG